MESYVSKKNDFLDNKPRWDLLPLQEISDIVDVYTMGAKKYGENRWQELENGYQRYKAALFRHLNELENGNLVDKESGLLHTAHIMWNAIALNYCLKHNDPVVFKDVVGFEDHYYVDNLGNVYSKDRFHRTNNNGFYRKGIKIKPSKTKRGYLQVCLSVNGKYYSRKVHRLVAEAFIPNPNNLQEVNHKNEDKTDNRVSNLEWCTREYNMNYGNIHYKLSENSDARNRVKPILKLDLNDNILCEYSSIISVAKDGYDPSFIVKVCKGKKDSAYGFKWKYKNNN